MMRLSAILLGVSLLLIAFTAQSFAAVSFVHEKTFTVPDLDSITQMKLVTQQGGTSLSVLATNGHLLELVDVVSDSVTFSRTVDSGFEFIKIEIADVNRDSVPDICVLKQSTLIDGLFPDSTMTFLDVYSACDTSLHSSLLLDNHPGVALAGGQLGGPVLQAHDFDKDGYPELLVSVEKTGGASNWYAVTTWTEGEIILFGSAPLQPSWQSILYASDLHEVNWPRGISTFIVAIGDTHYYDGMGIYENYSIIYLASVDANGIERFAIEGPPLLTFCSHGEISFGCVGDLVVGGEPDIVTKSYASYVDCNAYPTPAPTIVERMMMSTLVTKDSTLQIWSDDISGLNYTNFTYHPMLPGYFFALSGDTLLMFRGSDGTIRDRITNVPSGTKHWDYLYGDSIPRLVVVNGATVSIYHLDIATDVTDQGSPNNIPRAFVLHDPYPNPFNPSATLNLDTGPGGAMTLAVYNIRGQRMITLYDGTVESGKNLSFIWNAGKAASGVYFARLELLGEKQIKKMLLLK